MEVNMQGGSRIEDGTGPLGVGDRFICPFSHWSGLPIVLGLQSFGPSIQ